ncbi:MAG: prepilin-type N-terminal cleavage/methylation domain-containing protein [Phycisphaerae bacterium]
MRRTAFTLIELLVVIAIISLLVAMLVPSLGAVQDIARKAVCKTGIRGLALSNLAYASENNGHFVLAAEDITAPGGGEKRWHGRRESGGEFDASDSPLRDYIGDSGDMKKCPAFREFASGDGAFEAGTGGFGYNATYIGGRSDKYQWSEAVKHSARTSDPATAARTVMFTDAAYIQGRGRLIEYSFAEPPFFQLSPGPPSRFRPNPSVHFRHMDRCNVAWADGHVSDEEMTFSSRYLTHGQLSEEQVMALQFGWFGPESNEWWDLE